MAGTEFRLPCNLLIRYVVLGIVQRFIKKFGNDCNLGLKAVVIEEQAPPAQKLWRVKHKQNI